MTITLWHFLAVAAALFGIGLVGFLTRRNLITMFLCAEMMFQGVALNFVAFARYHANLQGQIFVLFILAVAACEAGVALATCSAGRSSALGSPGAVAQANSTSVTNLRPAPSS